MQELLQDQEKKDRFNREVRWGHFLYHDRKESLFQATIIKVYGEDVGSDADSAFYDYLWKEDSWMNKDWRAKVTAKALVRSRSLCDNNSILISYSFWCTGHSEGKFC